MDSNAFHLEFIGFPCFLVNVYLVLSFVLISVSFTLLFVCLFVFLVVCLVSIDFTKDKYIAGFYETLLIPCDHVKSL